MVKRVIQVMVNRFQNLKMKHLLALLFLALFAAWLPATPIEDALARFDKSPTVDAANGYFTLLNNEEFTDELIHFDSRTPADTLKQQVWYWAAEYYYDKQQYDIAATYGKKALPLCRVGNNRVIEADCLNLLAITYIRLSDSKQAADYALQCYRLDEASGDISRISSSLNTLTAIYLTANQPKEAEHYVLNGLELARKSGDQSRLAVLNAMASEVFHAEGNDVKALEYIEEAYEIDQKLGNTDRVIVRRAQKASVLIGLHRYADAEQDLAQVIPFFKQNGDKHSLGISCNKMGMALFSQNRADEAITYYREAAEIFTQLKDPYNEVHARKGLYESLWKSDPDAAKHELDRFNTLKDSIYNMTTAENLAKYNAEFGNDWLQLENHAEREAKRHAIIIGIVVALLLMVTAFVIWWVMRGRHKRQAAINESLSASIDELRAKYDQLQVYYNNAMSSSDNQTDPNTLSDNDKQFLDAAVETTNRLIHSGEVSVERIASELNISVFQLRQRLDELLGEKPQAFIQNIRMKRARYLLDHQTELSINEVAALCGYNDTPNFSRAFKKAFGISPTQYQARN